MMSLKNLYVAVRRLLHAPLLLALATPHIHVMLELVLLTKSAEANPVLIFLAKKGNPPAGSVPMFASAGPKVHC